jgi:hypothetical protein
MPLPCYDPVQFAAAFCARPLTHQIPSAADALDALRAIEYAEETIIRAENDCRVEYSQEAHDQVHRWYAQWVQRYGALARSQLPDDRDATALRDAVQRAESWLQVQAEIQRLTLPHAVLSEMARDAGLSPGNRSPQATP